MVFLLFLAACAGQRGTTTVDVGGHEVSCVEPPAEARRTLKLSANVEGIAGIAGAGGSIETKWQRIRGVSPRGADFDVISYQPCLAYAQGLLSQDAYEQMLYGAAQPAGEDGGSFRKKWVLTGNVFVEGKTGQAVEGAEIELTLEPLRFTATGADGAFCVTMLGRDEGRTASLRVRKDGFELYTRSSIRLTPTLGALDISLVPVLPTFFC